MISNQYVSQVRLRVADVPGFDHYPFSLPAVRHLDVLDLHPKVTFIVGENGSGKFTLMEAIAVSFGFNPEGGTRNFGFGTRTSHSVLHQCSDTGIHQVTYEETEHFQVMHDFVVNPKRMLDILLD